MQGDLYEYLLSHLSIAGRNGQFRTPRHIIRMMVQMLDPKPKERIGDLAAGTGGFLINAHQYILEKATSKDILEYDADGMAHHLIGDQLQDDARKFMKGKKYLRGFDNDSGMTMLRIGSMNLMLHGIQSPQFFYMDTLSKGYDGAGEFDVILMNPPFKGAVDKGDVHPDLPSDTTKSELLFLHLILRALDMGGRAAVIVPDGVLFGSSRAHVEVRKRIIEENRLDGVVSMPSGVFKPYAGVSTAVLLFMRGAQTKDIWFYDMEHDGFSLDDKRTAVAENDIPDVVACWNHRFDKKFRETRDRRIGELRGLLVPMKAERLNLQKEINRLTFELAVDSVSPPSLPPPNTTIQTLNADSASSSSDLGEVPDRAVGVALSDAQAKLANLNSLISNPQSELDRLTRQFWVTKEQVKANKYDLSASRYRQVDADAAYHEKPSVTLERLARLESVMLEDLKALESFFVSETEKNSKDWEFDILENLAERIDYGVTASANMNPVGPKFLRITDIQDGKVNWDEVPYCEITEKEQNQSLLQVGDIVFARTGATTGKSFLIQSCPENSVFASYLIRVRPGNRINPSYLFGFFQTDNYWKQISESATGSAQPGVNSTKLGQIKVPVPPLPEQERFARLLSRYERLRIMKSESERQIMRLFQSMLGESFGGNTVEKN